MQVSGEMIPDITEISSSVRFVLQSAQKKKEKKMRTSFYEEGDTISPQDLLLLEQEAKVSPDMKHKAVWMGNKLYSSSSLKRKFARDAFQRRYGVDLMDLVAKSHESVYESWHHHLFMWPIEPSQEKGVLHWIVLAFGMNPSDMKKSDALVGLVQGKVDTKNHKASLDYVEINPRFRGQKMCRPLVTSSLEFLLKKFPAVTKFYIENASAEVQAACFCYLKAAESLKLRLTDNDGKEVESSKVCIVHPSGVYFFFR